MWDFEMGLPVATTPVEALTNMRKLVERDDVSVADSVFGRVTVNRGRKYYGMCAFGLANQAISGSPHNYLTVGQLDVRDGTLDAMMDVSADIFGEGPTRKWTVMGLNDNVLGRIRNRHRRKAKMLDWIDAALAKLIGS